MNMLRKQKGYTLIELGIVAVVLSVLTYMALTTMRDELDRDFAKTEGARLAQLSSAALQFVLDGGADGVYNGTNFLKQNGVCAGGTSAVAYLPCTFANTGMNGIAYTTVVAAPIATVSSTAPTISGQARPDLAARIVQAANAAIVDTQIGGFIDHEINFPGDGSIDSTLDTVAGAGGLTALLDNEYIRRDGGNSPTANINWGGFGLSGVNVLNAVDGNFSDDIVVNDDATIRDRANLDNIYHEAGGTNRVQFYSQTEMRTNAYFLSLADFNGEAQFDGIIDANGNASFDGGQYTFNGVNVREFIDNGDVVDSGTTVPKPVCPAGLTPRIYAYPSLVTHNNQVETISGIDVYANDAGVEWNVFVAVNINGTWEVQGTTVSPSSSAKALVHTRCG